VWWVAVINGKPIKIKKQMKQVYKHNNGTKWNIKERTEERTLLNRIDSINIALSIPSNSLKDFTIV
jgi:hypothetical protein